MAEVRVPVTDRAFGDLAAGVHQIFELRWATYLQEQLLQAAVVVLRAITAIRLLMTGALVEV
jgi:hypothetical protein